MPSPRYKVTPPREGSLAAKAKWITKKKPTTKWISKKKNWITKKGMPKSNWITKKEKPKSWITKKEKPKSWITKKPLSIRQAVKDVVAEGGSPKLTTDEARMGRIDKKLGIIPADDHPIKDKNFKKGGRAGKQFGGRTNLLEELGRVEGEPSNRNRRAEISRVHRELNKGYKSGGRIGLQAGKIARGLKKIMKRHTHEVPTGPHTDVRKRKINPSFRNPNVESGRSKEIKRKNSWKNIAKSMIGLKSGGAVLKGKKVGIQIK